MKLGTFYEHQLPRPWTAESEHKLFKDTLDQVELADRLGVDFMWETEHHFLEEYAHSSAPEVFLAAASQRTRHIRLGHGIVQLPPVNNHPARVAERIATLDLVSDGRVEFGTGEGAAEVELGGFNVPQAEKRAMWLESLGVVTRMMVEEPFLGHEGKYINMPARNVVPKPLQRPHPPLWVACSRRETILLAARLGIGALTFSFVSPGEARQWVNDYYTTLERECEPIGYAVNANIAIVSGFMCDRSEQRAHELADEHHAFFGYGLGHYAFFGNHEPGKTNLWANYKANPVTFNMEGDGRAPDCIGTPDKVRKTLREFEEAGVDQVIFLSQAGNVRHEDLCNSLDLFGREVLPEFKERDAKRAREKAARMEPIMAAAMKRKRPLEIPDRPPAVIRAAGHH